jgi:outer membrane protein assembly factor BamA
LLFGHFAAAQDTLQLQVHGLDKGVAAKYKTAFKTKPELDKALNKLYQNLLQQGFLAASLDSLQRKGNQFDAYFYQGPAYRWAKLDNGNVEPLLLEEAGYREKLFFGQPLHPAELADLQEKLLQQAENNGYPFAETWLADIVLHDSSISAKIYLERHEYYRFAKPEFPDIDKKARINARFLQSYLGYKTGEAYDESKVRKFQTRLRELPYLEIASPTQIIFTGKEARSVFFLRNRRASRFDFVVGVLPTTDNITGRSKLNLTGNVNIDLYNPFGTGKRMKLEWQQLQPGTQDLKLLFVYPYVLHLPFGLDASFNLYKRDTSYLDLNSSVGVQYLFSGNNYLKAYWENRGTSILNINEAQILSSKQLPAVLDVQNNIFGLEFNNINFDYRFNPLKGYAIFAKAGAGLRRVKQNNDILQLRSAIDTSFSFAQLYDTVQLNSVQTRLEANLVYHIKLAKRSTLRLALSGASLLGQAKPYRNELFRIGGNKLLRGFDEESIFASSYAVATVEARYLLSTNAYAFVFGDFAYVEEISSQTRQFDRPIGFGLGLALETKVGIFGLTYALGTRQDQTLQIRNAKIHFGYVNVF